MTIDEIRKNAPEGATHFYQYKNGNVIYFKYFKDTDTLYRMTPNWCATDFYVSRLVEL